jgi:Ca2+-binding RTX toxin-like protein
LTVTTLPGATASDFTSLVGTTGDDLISVVNEDALIFVGALPGDDIIDVFNFTGSVQNYLIRGGDNNDSLNSDVIFRQSTLNGNGGNDSYGVRSLLATNFFGGQGNDSLVVGNVAGGVSATNSLIQGNLGEDFVSLFGGIANTTVNGNEGVDTVALLGAASNSFVQGGKAGDTIIVSTRLDQAIAGTVINGNDGSDFISDIAAPLFGPGTNGIRGSVSTTQIRGGQGDDSLNFAASNTANGLDLFGDDGNDTLIGALTGSRLTGGAGADLLSGNALSDTFIYNSATESTTSLTASSRSFDAITNFVQGSDLLKVGPTNANPFLPIGNVASGIVAGDTFSVALSKIISAANTTFVAGQVKVVNVSTALIPAPPVTPFSNTVVTLFDSNASGAFNEGDLIVQTGLFGSGGVNAGSLIA